MVKRKGKKLPKEKLKKLSTKELESLEIKEKICDTLMEKPHEFYVDYQKVVSGRAIIITRDMKEARAKFENNEYDMEDDDEDIEFDDIEDDGICRII